MKRSRIGARCSRTAVALFGLLLAAPACGDSGPVTSASPTANESSPPASETVLTVPAEDVSLVVILISEVNDDSAIGMRVDVDGGVVYDRAFASLGGHSIVDLPLDLAPGAHQLSVEAQDGTSLDLRLALPEGRRYLTVTYWPAGSDEDNSSGNSTPYFDNELSASPPMFG